MSRKAILVLTFAVSMGLFGQRSGAPGGTGSTGTGSTGSTGAAAGNGIGTSATQAGTPTTQTAIGGLSGQAASGPITTPSANTAGTPTLPSAMAGPAGTTGSTQANPDTLNNGSSFNNGLVGGGVAVGSGVLSTPGGTFSSPAPTAGISDAGRAGISANTAVNSGVQSSLETSTVVYTNGAPVNPAPGNVAGAAAGTGRLINDMGPSYFSNTVSSGGGATVSLGEVAAQLKAAHGVANARTLTNDDVQKMVGDNTGVTVARNMPPLGPGAAIPQGASGQGAATSGTSQTAAQSGGMQTAQNTMATNQPSQPASAGQPSQGASASQSASATQQSQTAAAGQQGAGTSPADATQSQPANTQATAGNSTTPQINSNPQSNDAQGRSRLPATSTFLPLLGLLGLASGGLGFLFRKFRR